MRALVVLVNADRRMLDRTEAVLSRADYLTAAVSTYDEATELLDWVTPDLLLVDIRLDAFNGLQLAIRTRLDHPQVPIIVTHVQPDAIFEAEAKQRGIDFLVAPPEDPEFLYRIESALHQRSGQQPRVRRWFRKQVAGTVQVNVANAQARIIDMSYGGVRLAFSDQQDIPMHFEIRLPSTETPIRAHRVWTALALDDQFWCGAELDEGASDWREFVNSVGGGTAL